MKWPSIQAALAQLKFPSGRASSFEPIGKGPVACEVLTSHTILRGYLRSPAHYGMRKVPAIYDSPFAATLFVSPWVLLK